MQITERRVGPVTVLDLEGRLTFNDSAGRLKDKVVSLVFQGEKQIVLNLAGLSYVDSAGLGEIVACYTHASKEHASVRLANTTDRIQDLLVMTKLLTVFDAYDSEEEAVKSFQT